MHQGQYSTFKYMRKIIWHRGINLHCNFEDAQQTQGSENRQAERSGLRLEVRPHDLEDGTGNHEAVEAVEGWLPIYSGPQGPHPQQHFEDEQPKKDEFGDVWNMEKGLYLLSLSHIYMWCLSAFGCQTAKRKSNISNKATVDIYAWGSSLI